MYVDIDDIDIDYRHRYGYGHKDPAFWLEGPRRIPETMVDRILNFICHIVYTIYHTR